MSDACRAIAALLLGSAACVAAAQSPDPVALLQRMANAQRELEYEGTLAYVHGGRIDTMKVTRTLGPDGPVDRLITLSGDRREVISDAARLQCLTPAGTIDAPVATRGPSPHAPVTVWGRVSEHYRLSVAGVDRVAGFEATVLDAAPLDAQRYAYRLWLERASGMLLASMLREPGGGLIEHLAFTELQLRQVQTAPAEASDSGPPRAPVGWRVSAPAGFVLVRRLSADGNREHLLYSDGLASVSIYIDPPDGGLRGATRRGAVNAFGRATGDAHLVVVGDLPAATIEAIAQSIQRAN